MIPFMITAILVAVFLAGAVAAGRWWRTAMTPNVGNLGAMQRWRATGGPEDVMLRRVSAASKSVDAAVIEAFDAPELRWQLDQAEQLIVGQLITSANLPVGSQPAVRREIEHGVARFETLCAQVILQAAHTSSAVVHERLDTIELSMTARAAARAELASLHGLAGKVTEQ